MEEKNCENHCPKCNSDEIDWGITESENDGWMKQRGNCNKCDCHFYEVSELRYDSTVIEE